MNEREKLRLQIHLYQDLIIIVTELIFLLAFKNSSKQEKTDFINVLITRWNEKINEKINNTCKRKAKEISKITKDPIDVSMILTKCLAAENEMIKDELIEDIKNILLKIPQIDKINGI